MVDKDADANDTHNKNGLIKKKLLQMWQLLQKKNLKMLTEIKLCRFASIVMCSGE